MDHPSGVGDHVLYQKPSLEMNEDKISCAVISFEGSAEDLKFQEHLIQKLAKKRGGLAVGSNIGKAGYDLTFVIAYLRDFAMTHYYLAESFETFVPWSKVLDTIEKTKLRIQKEHQQRLLPGVPMVNCRLTQLYEEGACIYFYLCLNFEDVPYPNKIFAEIEEILSCGGSLSHHHGVGKLRASFMDREYSSEYRQTLMDLKQSLDPTNVFGWTITNNKFKRRKRKQFWGGWVQMPNE